MAHSTKPLNYTQVDKFIKASKKNNSSTTFSAFKATHPKSKVSNSSYERRKILLLTGVNRQTKYRQAKKKTMGGYHRIDYEPVDKFIKENPQASFEDFVKAHKNITMCANTFGNRRKRLLGQSTSFDKPQLFMRLWSGKCSSETTAVIRDIIDALNKSGRAKLEVFERINPSMLEVREAGK